MLKRLAILLAGLLAIFVIVNFSYVKFLFPRPANIIQNQNFYERPNFLTINSLNISAPIIYVNQTNETAYESALQNGVAHYPGTALPGQAGNCYIFGHSSDFVWSKGSYKTVFASLPKIKIGDQIILTDASGTPFTYIVKTTAVVASTQLSALNQDLNKKVLTLQTSYPVGTALERFIAEAQTQ